MINNTPKNTADPRVNDLRAALEHRATWFALLIDEARKKGLDTQFARDAIHRCGCIHAHSKFPRTDSLKEFADAFANDNVVQMFEMDVQEASEEKLYIEFHYCPLVKAWKELGFDEKDIDLLCDIAMDGDRGIADEYDSFQFHLGDTIAKGKPVCQITFTKTGA